MKEVIEMLKNIWRYSINEGEYSGIVFADTIELAEEKVRRKYHDGEICVWQMVDDVYFDTENPDVLECYGC